MFLSPEQAPLIGKEYSEATAAKLDEEVKELVGERAVAVQDLLSRNVALLEEIARELLQMEVMESARFYEIIEGSAASQSTRTAVAPGPPEQGGAAEVSR